MVLGDIAISNARVFPNKIGIVDAQSGVKFTWKEFNERVNRLSNAMIGHGIKKGDRVGIISENSSQCAEFQFAVAKAGAIGCPLNYRLHEKQLEGIINSAAPKLLFVQDQFARLIHDISSRLKGVEHFIGFSGQQNFPMEYESFIQPYPISEPEIDIKEDDLVMISYSSGTTGLPKGVLSTHRNRVTYCIESCLFAEKFGYDDVALVSAPFCAGVGGQVQLIAPAFVGCSVVMYVLKGNTCGEVIEREKVTVILTTKSRMMPVWDFIRTSGKKYDLSSLRKVTTAGQSHSEKELRELMEFCGVSYTAKMYGLSETVAVGTRLLPHEIEAGLRPNATEKEKKRLQSVGKPLLSTKVKIVNDQGEEVPSGELGEVLISGDAVSPGYWNNPELNKKTFKNGWLYTKDIGVFDEDGYLYLKGRKDFMIKTGGFMASPTEIEQTLLLHPGVNEAVVLGVPHEQWGEAIKAVISLKKGSSVSEKELRAHCQQYLARFQVPKYFEFAENLPKDEAGRIELKEIRKLFGEYEEE
jgi:acyl-CoA synthetase (AMP-forming)/AMP-acid ligase II